MGRGTGKGFGVTRPKQSKSRKVIAKTTLQCQKIKKTSEKDLPTYTVTICSLSPLSMTAHTCPEEIVVKNPSSACYMY